MDHGWLGTLTGVDRRVQVVPPSCVLTISSGTLLSLPTATHVLVVGQATSASPP